MVNNSSSKSERSNHQSDRSQRFLDPLSELAFLGNFLGAKKERTRGIPLGSEEGKNGQGKETHSGISVVMSAMLIVLDRVGREGGEKVASVLGPLKARRRT